MIKSYRHKGLKELFETGKTSRVQPKFHARCLEVLDVVNRSSNTQAMNVPGYHLHPNKQFNPWRWSIWISGQWRITFEFDKGDAYRLDFEQYH